MKSPQLPFNSTIATVNASINTNYNNNPTKTIVLNNSNTKAKMRAPLKDIMLTDNNNNKNIINNNNNTNNKSNNYNINNNHDKNNNDDDGWSNVHSISGTTINSKRKFGKINNTAAIQEKDDANKVLLL
jgi:hypothetical protein